MKAFDKGSQTLVEAMKLAWARGSNAWLVMAGPSLSTFDDFIRTVGTNCPRLLNLPPFDEAQKRDLLALSTIVAQPSRVESLGLVLIEAWANSKPVVAADIAVSRELIALCGGGITVPFGQAEQLASAVENLLGDAALRQRMGAGGYEMSSQYDGDTAWRRTTAELERVAQSPGFSAKPGHAD
jgi:glycosyltransferase involved in cell wall biosynthesis